MTALRQRRPDVLRRQVARLERRCAALDRLSRRYSSVRLGIVLAGMAAAFAAYQTGGAAFVWLTLLFVAAFIGAVVLHRRVLRSLTRHRIYRRIKAAHAARAALDWDALPPPRPVPKAETHPFETDLNLTGERSLLHLLDTAVSEGGSERLRSWLLTTVPDPERIARRQALVRELAPLSAFRDRLALNGALVAENPDARWDGAGLLAWLDREDHGRILPWLGFLGALAAVNLTLAALHFSGLAPPWWIFTLTLYAWIYLLRQRDYGRLFDEAYYLENTLGQFRAVLLFLEKYRYGKHERLEWLCAPFCRAERKPSAELRRITWIAAAASSQKSEIVWLVLNALMPWDLFFAYRLDRCKAAMRGKLPAWLDTWYEIEALGALANFAGLHPGYALPEVLPEAAGAPPPLFEGKALGHPLLPETMKVRNDFTIDRPGEIALITGSNMSGKSTFLRTLGVNLCLAFAGGPVDAAALRTIPFRLFTCIQVTDSVNDGISYFYAEVRRLKALLHALEADHPYPLFFLIDEIFRGTNNRERLIGSRAFVRALAHGHGVGAISTHDLELVHLAEEVAGIHNFHFREEVREGRMAFDYRLRPGPCPTTNALKIMRMEGLPVEDAAATDGGSGP
ncbi:MutS-related protein [Rhodocaloribacter sp.]